MAGSEAWSTYEKAGSSTKVKWLCAGAQRKRTPRMEVKVPSNDHPRKGTTVEGIAGMEA